MRRYGFILCSLLVILVLSPVRINADSVDLLLSGSQVFFANAEQTGQWWKARLALLESQGMYLEYLKIEDYYAQVGAGFEIILLNYPIGQLWGVAGGEEYLIHETKNEFFRTGLRLELPLAFGELEMTTDVFFDDLTGIFPRYYTELKLSKWWLKGNLGVGNLLGSNDGYAFWVGFEI